jgi:hypothetical protein
MTTASVLALRQPVSTRQHFLACASSSGTSPLAAAICAGVSKLALAIFVVRCAAPDMPMSIPALAELLGEQDHDLIRQATGELLRRGLISSRDYMPLTQRQADLAIAAR